MLYCIPKMEHNILLKLPGSELNDFLDETAEIYVDNAKKTKLILPDEELKARRHLSANIRDAQWGYWFGQEDGEYDIRRKKITLGHKLKQAVIFPDGKNRSASARVRMSAVHEIGHALQFNYGMPLNNIETAKLYYEIANDWAEIMVSLSHFRSGGEHGIKDAKLEFADDVGNGGGHGDLRLLLRDKLKYVIIGDNEKWEEPVSYSKLYADVFRILKTMDVSVNDAIRACTVFQRHGLNDIADKYDEKFRGRSFTQLLGALGRPQGAAAVKHLAPITDRERKEYIDDINM